MEQIVLNDRFVAVEWKGDTIHNVRIMFVDLAEVPKVKS